MRLLHAQAQMEDDRKLSEYSLPEGAVISALFEPDVDIDIVVFMGFQAEKLTVSNITSIKVLKTLIRGAIRSGVTPEKLEIRLGDVTLEDMMPLHFYRIQDGSRLELLKPYIGVTIENNFGKRIYWRLKRKDLIKDVKVNVASRQKFVEPQFGHSGNEMSKDGLITSEGLRIYLATDDLNFNELDDDETVDSCELKDGDYLFLLFYRWLSEDGAVRVRETGMALQGVEAGDTILGIKLRVQDQMGLEVPALNVFVKENLFDDLTDYFHRGQRKRVFTDYEKPFDEDSQFCLIVITDEELQAEAPRIAEEWKAELERKQERKKRKEKKLKQSSAKSKITCRVCRFEPYRWLVWSC